MEEEAIEDNRPDDIISSNTLHIIETTIACGIDPLMFIIGTPGNLICCIVFWKRGLKDRMNLVLFSLGLVDFFCVFFFFLLGIFCPFRETYSGSKPYFADLIKWRMREYTEGRCDVCCGAVGSAGGVGGGVEAGGCWNSVFFLTGLWLPGLTFW